MLATQHLRSISKLCAGLVAEGRGRFAEADGFAEGLRRVYFEKGYRIQSKISDGSEDCDSGAYSVESFCGMEKLASTVRPMM